MYILSRGGNRLHAPEHSNAAVISAYVSGADIIELTIQTTKDNQLVCCSSDDINAFTGSMKKISQLTLDELYRENFSATFRPRNSLAFSYFNPAVSGRRMQIELMMDLLRHLPPDVKVIIKQGNATIESIIQNISKLHLKQECIFAVDNLSDAKSIRQLLPAAGIIISRNDTDFEQAFKLLQQTGADGISLPLPLIYDASLNITSEGQQLKQFITANKLRIGTLLIPTSNDGCFTDYQYAQLQQEEWIWAMASDSLLQVEEFHRKQFSVVHEPFSGNSINRRKFSFGYAKANQYAEVYQNNGVHIDIKPYDKEFITPTDPLEKRLAAIEDKLTGVAKDWPYYSGGGVGVLEALTGDFNAEVDYSVTTVAQATTLEMAIVNVDPGAHVNGVPKSFRDKDSFYDPHGAPPFVGVEHDENDGYRINWNHGSEYDNNGYGRPVGDGWNAKSARIRLQRRGNYFAAYYKNQTDAADWVCVGVIRNDSMNNQVFLRCVAKRWRQENPDNPSQYMPIIPNHYIFKNLNIQLYV